MVDLPVKSETLDEITDAGMEMIAVLVIGYVDERRLSRGVGTARKQHYVQHYVIALPTVDGTFKATSSVIDEAERGE
jgi:hypothetical protein